MLAGAHRPARRRSSGSSPSHPRRSGAVRRYPREVTDDRDIPPAELRALARERSKARREHRFADADRIRAEIEAQGWNVVDRGAEARLVRAHPLDVVDPDGVTRYGWSGAVPEPEAGDA